MYEWIKIGFVLAFCIAGIIYSLKIRKLTKEIEANNVKLREQLALDIKRVNRIKRLNKWHMKIKHMVLGDKTLLSELNAGDYFLPNRPHPYRKDVFMVLETFDWTGNKPTTTAISTMGECYGFYPDDEVIQVITLNLEKD